MKKLTLKERVLERAYPGLYSRGYSEVDGTAQFYRRVGHVVQDGFTVLDLGAGRGATLAQLPEPVQRLALFAPHRVRRIGVDVDPAVKDNPYLHESHLLDLQAPQYRLPLPADAADLVLADWVIEHLEDPVAVFADVYRVLKPGGTFAFRTINRRHYVAVGARVLESRAIRRLSGFFLHQLQQDRREDDVFPKFYRCNTPGAIADVARATGAWTAEVHFIEAEPSYLMRNLPSALAGIAYERASRVLPLPRSTLVALLRKPRA
jgi:SAM-dependent methyltransferase